MLPKAHRLPPKESFIHTQRLTGDFLVVKFKKTSREVLRIGFVISKRVDTRASRRNRVRRILSQTVQELPLLKRSGYDILCIITKSVDKDQEELIKKELVYLLSSIRL